MSDDRSRQNPQPAPKPPVIRPTEAAIEDLAPRLTPEQEDKLRGGLSNREPGVQTN